MSKSFLNQLMPAVSRGLRNNNPGNIRTNSANNWKGKVPISQNKDANKSFEQFYNVHYGIRAMMILLKNYYTKNNLTSVKSILSKYAPSFENNTKAYIDTVVNIVGTNEIPKLDKQSLISLAKAIHYVENGKQYFNHLTNEDFEIGYNLIGSNVDYTPQKKN